MCPCRFIIATKKKLWIATTFETDIHTYASQIPAQDTRFIQTHAIYSCVWRLWVVFLGHGGGALSIFKSPACIYNQVWTFSLSASHYLSWASVAGGVCRPRSAGPCTIYCCSCRLFSLFSYGGSIGLGRRRVCRVPVVYSGTMAWLIAFSLRLLQHCSLVSMTGSFYTTWLVRTKLGRSINTETGLAGCRRVDRTHLYLHIIWRKRSTARSTTKRKMSPHEPRGWARSCTCLSGYGP